MRQMCHIDSKIVGKKCLIPWQMGYELIRKTTLSICSSVLVTGPGMAEKLQHLPGANGANSNTG